MSMSRSPQAYPNQGVPVTAAKSPDQIMADKYAMNRLYMRNTLRKRARAPQASGGSLTQAWAAGQLLTFNIPSAQNAYLEGLMIRFEGTVNPVTGAAAAYALNPSAPFSLVDTVFIDYNGPQARLRPYILRDFYMLTGYQQLPLPSSVIAGQVNAYIQSYLSGGTSLTVGANNTWDHAYYIPLNWVHPWDSRGLLPIMGGETVAQVRIQCAASAVGVDPVLSPIAPAGGTGNAATVVGSFKVYAVYRDGDTLNSPNRMQVDISGLPTAQVNLDNPLILSGVGTGAIARGKLTTMAEHKYILLTVIDGNQSNKFAAWSNISYFDLAKDSTGGNTFMRFGTGTNIDFREYLADIRGVAEGGMGSTGQDLDEGIIPLLAGPTYGEPDAGSLGGTMSLNTGQGGWNDVNYGLQFTTLGAVAGINSRVEVHEFFINPSGLQLV